MNIDLLFTQEGEAGLIANQNFIQKAVGVLFDPPSCIFTIEFADMDHMEFNIPVDEEFIQYLDMNATLHLGSVINGRIGQAYQVPLLFTDDPYRNEVMDSSSPYNALSAFERFMQSCVAGQPVHREDLADEDQMGCVLGEAVPSSLEFAPHLARRHALESKPQATPSINAPGMGLGGGSQTRYTGGGYQGGNGRDTKNYKGKDDKK